jgi:hypothetical protein
MAVHDTANFHLYVQLLDNSFVEVGSLTRWNRPRTRPRSTTVLLGGGSIQRVGGRDDTMSISGILDPADVGQTRLRTAETTESQVRVAVVRSGGTGKSYLATVTTTSHDASADETTDQTVTFDLVIDQSTALVYPPPPGLAIDYDWDPLSVTEREVPRLVSNVSEPSVLDYNMVLPTDAGELWNGARTIGPISRDKWRTVNQAARPIGVNDSPPNGSGVSSNVLQPAGSGPVHPNATCFRVSFFNPENGAVYSGGVSPMLDFAGGFGNYPNHDNQDATKKRRFIRMWFKAGDSATIGKKFHSALYSPYGDTTTKHRDGPDFVLTNAWQPVDVELLGEAERAAGAYMRCTTATVAEGGNLGNNVLVAMVVENTGTRLPTNVYDRTYPRVLHEEFGVESSWGHQNGWWPSDTPTLGGGATDVASTVQLPDDDEYTTPDFARKVTLPVGGYMTTPAARLLEIVYPGDPPVPVTEFAYGHVWVGSGPGGVFPADGALRYYLVATDNGGHDFGSLPLVRDPSQLLAPDGSGYYRTATPFQVNPGAVSNPPTTSGYRQFIPKIQNDSGGALVIHCGRCGLTNTEERNVGHHNAFAVRKAISAPAISAGKNISLIDPQRYISVARGFIIWRGLLPYDMGDAKTLGMMGSPGFYQSGPYGSASWACDSSLEVDSNPMPRLQQTMFGDSGPYDQYNANVRLPAGIFPAWCQFDFVIAWDRAIAKLYWGLGHGPGTSIEWLTHGQTWHGQVVSMSYPVLGPWEFFDHIQFGGDRDKTRHMFGWIRRITLSKQAIVHPTFQSSVEDFIANNYGPRIQFA